MTQGPIVDWDLAASLAGKAVVVTGAGGGIGKAVVEGFGKVGASVVAVDLEQVLAEEAIARLDDPTRHMVIEADLVDLTSHDRVIAACLDRYGRVDILTHLAAVLRRRETIDEITEEDWDIQIDTNLKATFFLNRRVAQQMIRQGRGGRIINFTSQAWWTGGYGGSVVYAASKAGIVAMSRGLARTLAPYGITVNTVAPGAVDTPMIRIGLTDEELAGQVAPIPMGRMADPDEMVSTVLYLAAEQSRYITGSTVNATGGWLMY